MFNTKHLPLLINQLKAMSWLGRLALYGVSGILAFFLIWTMQTLGDSLKLESLLELMERKAYDLRMSAQMLPRNQPSKDIAIITFDDTTLVALEDEYGAWPWSRRVQGEFIEFLANAQAKLITYDIMFVGQRKEDAEGDQKLVEAVVAHPQAFIPLSFDNDKEQLEAFHKTLTPAIYQGLYPVALSVIFSPKAGHAKTLFIQNSLGFNNFRPILPQLYQVPRQLHLINHTRDHDGVSRSNPLIFSLMGPDLLKSTETEWKPFKPDSAQLGECKKITPPVGGWFKTPQGKIVNAQGQLLNACGQLLEVYQPKYYPQTSLRMLQYLEALKYPQQREAIYKQPWLWDEHNILHWRDWHIPLGSEGQFYVNWYTTNVEVEASAALLNQKLLPKLAQLQQQEANGGLTAQQKQQLRVLQAKRLDIEKAIHSNYEPKPYVTVPAWRTLQAMKHQKTGQLTQADRQLIAFLKDKILFVGNTSVGGYDIKTTPVHRAVAGVVQQAVLFDNLYQNHGYLYRLSPGLNQLITLWLALLVIVLITRISRVWLGLVGLVGLVTLFILLNLVWFKTYLVWVNLVSPVLTMLVVAGLTYVLKYMLRNRDYERTYKLATTDGLTGLYNHRYFQDYLKQAMNRADRQRGQATVVPLTQVGQANTVDDVACLSLILIDIDFFKNFNDNYGHQAGDEVLRQVAQKLKSSVREEDLVARYGGEEMAVVLEKAGPEAALEVAQKLVDAVAEEAYAITDAQHAVEAVKRHITISVGVATYPLHGQTPAQLIEFADQGLYRAKKSGRNRVGAQYNNVTPPTSV